jgi:hypothetical protein
MFDFYILKHHIIIVTFLKIDVNKPKGKKCNKHFVYWNMK